MHRLIVGIIAFGLVTVLACTGSGRGQTVQTSEAPGGAGSQLPINSATTRAIAARWVDVASWQGNGDFDSPSFHISANQWRVVWAAATHAGAGEFSIAVHKGDGALFVNLIDLPSTVATEGPVDGGLIVKGEGDFFLRINTLRTYEITVQQFSQVP